MRTVDQNKQAGVIVLYEECHDALILTQRSHQLREHPGEICFPGGRWQEGDVDFFATALRELQEELGIESGRLHSPVLMNTVRTQSGFVIHPWFAKIPHLEPYQLDCQEVIEVFRLPMADVQNPDNYQPIRVRRGDQDIESYQFATGQRFVWGATVRIMMQLTKSSATSK